MGHVDFRHSRRKKDFAMFNVPRGDDKVASIR